MLNSIRNRTITAGEEPPASSSSSSSPVAPVLPPALEQIRHRGWRGGRITPHRAFVRLPLTPARIAESVGLAVSGTAAWILLLPLIGHFWGRVFAFWGAHLDLHSNIVLVPQGWGALHFGLPCFALPAGPASGFTWAITAAITVLGFAATFLIQEEGLPWAYLIRAFCLLQATALVYFALASARFPHDLPGYTVSMLVFSSILIGLVPVLYAFTYYLLNFSLAQKLFLTFVTMAHLVLFVPHQYMLHIYVLHGSVLFMPLLYFVFGPFLDILAFVGFYSWGMSWHSPESMEI